MTKQHHPSQQQTPEDVYNMDTIIMAKTVAAEVMTITTTMEAVVVTQVAMSTMIITA